MSLKYRLIVLTVAVFVVVSALGTVLGVWGARRLAERQLLRRLTLSARRLAASPVPLSEEALTPLAGLLDAHVLAMTVPTPGSAGTAIVAHSGGQWPWRELHSRLSGGGGRLNPIPAGGRRYYHAGAVRAGWVGRPVRVVLFADEAAVRQPTRTILYEYLLTLVATSVLLAAGIYLVGLRLVRRISALSRSIDRTLPEKIPERRRRGDELSRLSEAFGDLLGRLERSRQRLAAQQRLATAGKIASTVAHEVRNPLQAMRLTLQMVRQDCPQHLREALEMVLGEIDRLSLLTDELLVLAGKDARRVEAVDLAAEIRETLRLLSFQLRQRQIEAELELPPLPPVVMDRSRCRQLFLNLLLNAIEASPRGGVVRVAGRVEGGQVVLSVVDNGPGFPQAVLAGRAEEFFSTKTTGAGLGLSICRRIVQEAGGRLNLYNTGRGAAAEVTLPCGKLPRQGHSAAQG